MHPMTWLSLGLGLILLLTAPIPALTASRAAAGRIRRGGAAGIRIKETNASNEAWLAGHRAAADVVAPALVLDLIPVALGMVLSLWWPWVGFSVVLLGVVSAVGTSVWMTLRARSAARAVAANAGRG